jgi:hypothetical protein
MDKEMRDTRLIEVTNKDSAGRRTVLALPKHCELKTVDGMYIVSSKRGLSEKEAKMIAEAINPPLWKEEDLVPPITRWNETI